MKNKIKFKLKTLNIITKDSSFKVKINFAEIDIVSGIDHC